MRRTSSPPGTLQEPGREPRAYSSGVRVSTMTRSSPRSIRSRSSWGASCGVLLSRRSSRAWGVEDCVSRASSAGAIMLSAHLAFAAGTAQAGNHAMPFPEALRALNHRDFRVFWTGQLVSLIGTWMQSVAQSWLVLQLSGSPLKLGLIGTLQFAPVLLFSVVAGSFKKKIPNRRLILPSPSRIPPQALHITTPL